MKIWVDDVRPAPKGYGCTWLTTVNQVKKHIIKCEEVDKQMGGLGGLFTQCSNRTDRP